MKQEYYVSYYKRDTGTWHTMDIVFNRTDALGTANNLFKYGYADDVKISCRWYNRVYLQAKQWN